MMVRPASVCLLACLLLAGCEYKGRPGGGPAEAGLLEQSGLRRRNEPVRQLAQLLAAGQFAKAHQLAGEQAALAGGAGDAVLALWWRCQELGIYLREDQPAARTELAERLAAEPLASDRRFCLSGGWEELFAALVQGGRKVPAGQLLRARHDALLAVRDDSGWWGRQMTELSQQADALGDAELARAARAAGARAQTAGSGRRLAAAPPASQPDRTILPRP